MKVSDLCVGLSLILNLTACSSSPCETAGRREFQKQHPDYKIEEVVPDGNASGVTYIAHFKKPNDPKVYFADISREDNKSHKCEVGIREF